MRKNITRVLAAVAGSAAVGALGIPGVVAPGAAAQAMGPARTATGEVSRAPAPGTQLWVARYNGPANSYDNASSMAVSPAGGRIFVTGSSAGTDGANGFLTVAYAAATGAQLWARRYDSPAGGEGAGARSIVVSPDGATVFVTGYSLNADGVSSDVTVAYAAATGAQRWLSRYSSGGQGSQAYSVAVSHTGATVYVTGSSDGPHGLDYATVAYEVTTGAQAWIRRYNGSAGGDDLATSVVVGPAGKRVFVTGSSARADGSGNDYATIAYKATTGAQLWVTRHGGPADSDDAIAVAVSPSGGRVFVTGSSLRAHQYDYATIGYNAATGAQVWARRYNGPGNGDDRASAMAVSPTGGKVFVTGVSVGAALGEVDYATIAYGTTTGTQVWVKRRDGYPQSVAVSHTGGTVFVTGQVYGSGKIAHQNYGTIAYRAATGERLWTARYDGPAHQQDWATAVAVSPTSGTVFVTGYSLGIGTQTDYATLAYAP
jgi:hypothetical protein